MKSKNIMLSLTMVIFKEQVTYTLNVLGYYNLEQTKLV